MGSLASELRPIAASVAAAPRVYVDANVPSGARSRSCAACSGGTPCSCLRTPDLRRASDREHFRRARDLGRTLVTLDCDFLDERRFPACCSPGVVVCRAPDEPALKRLLKHLDRGVLRVDPGVALPLRGRTLALTADVAAPGPARRRRRSRRR